jgi:tetratricopeptide (TPR) repeat protein
MGKRLLAIGIVTWVVALGGAVASEDGESEKNTAMQSEPGYVRQEDDTTKVFYKVYAELMPETPPDIARFVDILAERTALAKQGKQYPVDAASIAKAADGFVVAAREAFSVELSVDRDDAAQLDRLANAHLIDERLRPYFEGATLKEDLSEEEAKTYVELAEKLQVPDEPLLYYCMGCFWGQWLVKHRQAQWVLYEPLNPVQSFPDMVSWDVTVCMLPFSHVVKKLSDPQGDSLAFTASPQLTVRHFPPFPLIVSIADAKQASRSMLPPAARQGLREQEAGDVAKALELYDKAIAESPESPAAHALAIQAAWGLQMWDEVEARSLAALRIMPDHPVLNHNLAVLYSSRDDGLPKAVELLEKALRAAPGYGRAHITIASCLLDMGETDKAIEHLEWVIQNDTGLKTEAEQLLSQVERERTDQD